MRRSGQQPPSHQLVPKDKAVQQHPGSPMASFLSPEKVAQLEVAASLGVSDSLVSDYRRGIQQAPVTESLVKGSGEALRNCAACANQAAGGYRQRKRSCGLERSIFS